jgi:hypothetical protein
MRVLRMWLKTYGQLRLMQHACKSRSGAEIHLQSLTLLCHGQPDEIAQRLAINIFLMRGSGFSAAGMNERFDDFVNAGRQRYLRIHDSD